MNKRIEELKEQATRPVKTADGRILGEHVDTQVFAELIIRECACVAVETQTKNDVRNIISKNPAKDFSHALIKHFGIKARPVPILTQVEEDFLTRISTSGAFTLEATKKAWE